MYALMQTHFVLIAQQSSFFFIVKNNPPHLVFIFTLRDTSILTDLEQTYIEQAA